MKKQIITYVLVLCLAFSSLLFTACQQEPKKYSTQSFEYFDTVTIITGYAHGQEDFDTVSTQILEKLSHYHQLFDIYKRYEGVNNLCTVNQVEQGAHTVVTVDSEIIELLLYGKEMYQTTQGMVNVAMGSVLSLWHNCRTVGANNPTEAVLPNEEQLQEASLHTNIEDMIINQTESTVYLADPKMLLDVGAIAKGYAVEQISLWMKQEGITGYVLNVGGNVSVIGAKPNGELWTVGVENPNNTEDSYVAYLQLKEHSLVTSGSYQRFYMVNGKKYHHIIHPQTLMPSEGYLSVSVLCNNSALGDALSTALFCMPLKEGLSLVESLENVEAMWIDESGVQSVSSGWKQYEKS